MPEIVIASSPSESKTQVVEVPSLSFRLRYNGVRYERVGDDAEGRPVYVARPEPS